DGDGAVQVRRQRVSAAAPCGGHQPAVVQNLGQGAFGRGDGAGGRGGRGGRAQRGLPAVGEDPGLVGGGDPVGCQLLCGCRQGGDDCLVGVRELAVSGALGQVAGGPG